MSIDNLRQYGMLDGENLATLWRAYDTQVRFAKERESIADDHYLQAQDEAHEVDVLLALLAECAPHVFSAAEAEHLLDGFRPQRRPLDDLADRVHAALGSNVKSEGAEPLLAKLPHD